MGRISTGVGLISGINSAQIIDQLIQLDSGPVTQLQQRITTANAQKDAYNGLLSAQRPQDRWHHADQPAHVPGGHRQQQ